MRLPGGALERTALRMDSYPMKDGAALYLYLEDPARLAAIQTSFRDETARRAANGGKIIVPTVTIKGPRSTTSFRDVEVTSHDVRPDVFQPGSITALDVLLSLGEQGHIGGLEITWHAMLGDVENVNHYMVDWIALPEVLGEEGRTLRVHGRSGVRGSAPVPHPALALDDEDPSLLRPRALGFPGVRRMAMALRCLVKRPPIAAGKRRSR